jgi:hypothetical protein
MTFKWLLENAPGWVAYIVASMETSGETGTGNRWVNKMALLKYVNLFEEGRELVRQKKEEKQKPKSGESVPCRAVYCQYEFDMIQ